jgi:hypothetical protein
MISPSKGIKAKRIEEIWYIFTPIFLGRLNCPI